MNPVRLVAAIALVASAPAVAAPLASAAFRDRLAAAMTASTGIPTTVVDDRTFKTTAADGTELTVNIDKAYAQYVADPSQVEAVIARMVAALPNGGYGIEPVEQLVVIVRPSDYLRRSVGQGASLATFIAPRPLAGDLSYFLAVDSPTTIRSASKGDLARCKLSEDAAWTRATANVKSRVGPLVLTRLGDENGASGLGAESGLAPSLLTEPDFCSPRAPSGWQGQVVLVYSKDMFLFAMPTDAAQTRKFWRTVKQEVSAGRTISSTPIVCRGGHWEVATGP